MAAQAVLPVLGGGCIQLEMRLLYWVVVVRISGTGGGTSFVDGLVCFLSFLYYVIILYYC